jgi:hypothetical protein
MPRNCPVLDVTFSDQAYRGAFAISYWKQCCEQELDISIPAVEQASVKDSQHELCNLPVETNKYAIIDLKCL